MDLKFKEKHFKKCVQNSLIFFYNECDLFTYLENTSYFHFLKKSILSKYTFYSFKGRLETSLLWDLILVCERIKKSNSWAGTRVSLYKAWRADSIKTPWRNLSDSTPLLLGAGLLSLSWSLGILTFITTVASPPLLPSHPSRFLVSSSTQ